MRKYNNSLRLVITTITIAALGAAYLSGCAEVSEAAADTAEDTKTEAAVPDVVNIGVQTLITPELAARVDNVYEEALGTSVNLVQFNSGADVNKAIAGGSIDIASIGTSPAAIGISQDLGYEVIWMYDVIGSAESLVAQEDSGITEVSDLAGKKVATPFASTSHYSLLSALDAAGLSTQDVTLLDLQPDDIYAAWVRGDIDAAYVWNPVLQKLFDEGAVVVTDSAELADQGIVTADLGVVRTDFAEQYPDLVTSYVKTQIGAVEDYNTDPDTVIQKIAEGAGIGTEEAAEEVKGFSYPTGEEQVETYLGDGTAAGTLPSILESTAEFLKTQEALTSVPDAETFEQAVDGSFVEAALHETK